MPGVPVECCFKCSIRSVADSLCNLVCNRPLTIKRYFKPCVGAGLAPFLATTLEMEHNEGTSFLGNHHFNGGRLTQVSTGYIHVRSLSASEFDKITASAHCSAEFISIVL